MRIPKKIKILGLDYEVIEQEEVSDSSAVGLCYFQKQTILLEKKQCQQQKEATLIHEILEAINKQLELELPHKTISALETGLYQVLKENFKI